MARSNLGGRGVEIRGISGCATRLAAFGREARQEAVSITLRNSLNALDYSRQIVPKDTRRMMRSLTINMSESGLTFILFYDPDTFDADGQPYYPLYVEYGTRLHPAQPTLEPTLDEIGPQYTKDMERALRRLTR